MKKALAVLLALVMCVPLFAACGGNDAPSEDINISSPWSDEGLKQRKTEFFGGSLLIDESDPHRFDRLHLYYLGTYADENGVEYEGILATNKFILPEEEGGIGFGTVEGVYLYKDGVFKDASNSVVLEVDARIKLFKAYYAVLAELLDNQKLPE